MGNVIAYCEFEGGALKTSALSCLAAAGQLAQHHGGQVIALLVGPGAAAAGEAAKTRASQVLTCEDAGPNYLAETHAPVLVKAIAESKATAVVATATNLGKDLLPRAAGLLGCGMSSEVTKILGKNMFQRPIHAGNATATVELSGEPTLITIRQSEFAAAAEGAAGSVSALSAGTLDAKGAKFVGLAASKSERPELADAKIIISGGRGMKNGENFKHLEELADLLGAAVGASRAATDAGYVPADLQVGQTGKIVAPKLYIAVAISGAIQHLAGMKGSRVIVAINKDPEAPIFQIADYGLVEAWETALPALTAEAKTLVASR